MPTILARNVISDVARLLVDTDNTRWSHEELLSYLNAAQLAIANRRPDASVINTTLSCVANAKQTLPAAGLRLIKVIGNTDGTAITRVDQALMDEQRPHWRDDSSPANAVEHYLYDDRDPKHFYVFPVVVADHSIDLVYSVAPAVVEASDVERGTEVISIDDVYLSPLMDYMLYRCYQKDSDSPNTAAKAASHYTALLQSIGDKTQADAVVADPFGQCR